MGLAVKTQMCASVPVELCYNINVNTLYTIPFSHYNEKARWALDLFGVEYKEKKYMPMFHFLPLIIAKRGEGSFDTTSSPFSTPLLITSDGQRLDSSCAIMEYISQHYSTPKSDLYFDPEALKLETHYHDYLGRHTRRIAYYNVFKNKYCFLNIAHQYVGPVQARLFPVFSGLIQSQIEKHLSVNADAVDKSIRLIKKEFTNVSEILSDGRSFLLGERFSAADLSFACMAAPCLMISSQEGYCATLQPFQDELPELVALAKELKETPAGKFALRMFREQRHVKL